MLSNWPIRVKFLIGLGLLLLLVSVLSWSGLHTTYAYRSLVRDLRERAVELPMAAELNGQVADLRITLSLLEGLRQSPFPDDEGDQIPTRVLWVREQFRAELDQVEQTLSDYRTQLEDKVRNGSPMADNQREWLTIREINDALLRVYEVNCDEDWVLDDVGKVDQIKAELEHLQQLATELPSHLHRKLRNFREEVKSEYRALIVGTWITSILATLILVLFLKLFHRWIFRPLETLINGSRRVAAGQFSYRIHLETDDEMAELAGAMNAMTARFRAIRDDLDHQVRERTKQVVRGEQLASVGFLAAGVAHEINNPLASIAISAESLEGRFAEMLDKDHPQHDVVDRYLRMIQSEAFRCKGITEKLLDFSRIGPTHRQNTELSELVQGVIEMVGHVGKYQEKHIEFDSAEAIVAPVNPQEIKQVTLNLLCNALDSLNEGGAVRVGIGKRDGFAELTFRDDGCGMEPHVLKHVFEPFFTRRKSGQGTGLGLSITHRIVADHGGEVHAESPGPGQGSTFQVRLPLIEKAKETEDQYQAAKPTQAAVC